MQVVKEAGNNFFTNDFAKINSRACTLLLNFTEESFSYTILQNDINTVVYSAVSDAVIDLFQFTETQLSEIFNTEPVFKYTFGKIIVLIDTIYSSIVPNPFFDENKLAEILSFNLNLPKTDLHFQYDSFNRLDYKNVFVNSFSLEKALAKNFIETSVVSSETVLLDFIEKRNVSSEYFHLHLGFKKMHCCYFKNKELVFNNIFSIQTEEDILYNVLNIYKQLGLNNEVCVLNVSGVISLESNKFELLYKYIKHIQFAQRPIKLNFAERLAQMPEHYFLHHYAALL